ncbi:hypothetical protein ACFU7Z_18460, partial [Kitasatospora sp. NPDC057518]
MGSLVTPLVPAFAAPSGDNKDKVWTPPNTPLQRTASVPGKADTPKPAAAPTGSPNWVPPKATPQPK